MNLPVISLRFHGCRVEVYANHSRLSCIYIYTLPPNHVTFGRSIILNTRVAMWSPVYFNCALGGSSNRPIRVEFLSLEDGVPGPINYTYELYTHTIYTFVYKRGGGVHTFTAYRIHTTEKKLLSFTEQRTVSLVHIELDVSNNRNTP